MSYRSGSKLIVDGDHYAYWSSTRLRYVRDGGDYSFSEAGPHFLDLGVMGNCRFKCPNCYMKNRQVPNNMSPEAVDEIIYKYRNTLCQVSFGGAGDPADYVNLSSLADKCNNHLLSDWTTTHTTHDVDTSDEANRKELQGAFNRHMIPVTTIARHMTINPRGRAFTAEEVTALSVFDAVGLSCGQVNGFDYDANTGLKNVERLLRQADDEDNFENRPNFILHFIVGAYHGNLRKFVQLIAHPCVSGVLLLGEKRSGKYAQDGAFYNREGQIGFWKSVADVHAATGKNIGVDSCLAPFVDTSIFASPALMRRALHPCDAGRFSMYVHADGSNWLCSCGEKSVASWEEMIHTPQFCANVLPPATHQESAQYPFQQPAQRTEWPNPEVVIQEGPMTNSSSSSYFVITPKHANLKLNVVDFAQRDRDSEYTYGSLAYDYYNNNKRLVRLTPDEWAGHCATSIVTLEDKKRMDVLTRRILSGDSLFYLVANRDDDEVEPTHYDKTDVTDDENTVLIAAGEEH